MAAYEVSYKYRDVLEGLTPREADLVAPEVRRVSSSNAQRAISSLTNDLKANGRVRSKGEIVIAEVRLVP